MRTRIVGSCCNRTVPSQELRPESTRLWSGANTFPALPTSYTPGASPAKLTHPCAGVFASTVFTRALFTRTTTFGLPTQSAISPPSSRGSLRGMRSGVRGVVKKYVRGLALGAESRTARVSPASSQSSAGADYAKVLPHGVFCSGKPSDIRLNFAIPAIPLQPRIRVEPDFLPSRVAQRQNARKM